MRLLIVEDEAKTADYLYKGLQENGFSVDVERGGEQGLSRALAFDFDLIILDVMLPGRDGWSVLQEIRRAGKNTPVLFLTARDAVADRVRGLDLGADDYLVKPFSFAELLARVRNITRRDSTRAVGPIQVADLVLDPIRHSAERAERCRLCPRGPLAAVPSRPVARPPGAGRSSRVSPRPTPPPP